MFKKTFTAIFAISLSFFTVSAAQASTNFSLYPLKINVKEGQTFRVAVSVNPKGVKNYTIKTSLKFPADLVSLKTWTYANDWMPLKKSAYDSFSNINGTLVKTAGYPEGFDKTTNFGSAVFAAKKSGTGVIEFASDNLALGADNSNLYGGGNQVALVISDLNTTTPSDLTNPETSSSTPEEVNPPVGEQAPTQLFDIVLEIDSYNISKIEDLTSRVTFMSFGKVPTSVDLTFDILDANGQIIHTEKDNITVETEQVITKRFSGFALQPGKYTLRVTTLYNTSVKDEFSQPFAVSRAASSFTSFNYSIVLYLLILFLILLIIFFIIAKRRKHKKQQTAFKR